MKTKKFKVVKTTAFAMLCALSFGAINVKAEGIPGVEVTSTPSKYLVTSSNSEYTYGVKCTSNSPTFTLHYSLNDGVEKTKDEICSNPDSVVDRLIDLSDYDLKTISENKLKYYLTDDDGNQTETYTAEILEVSSVIDSDILLLNKDFLTIRANVAPMNTQLNLTKVTDKNIINKVGTDYIYKIDLTSEGKPLSYYDEKYKLNRSMAIYGTIPNGLSKSKDLNIYLTTSNLSMKHKLVNCVDSSACDSNADGREFSTFILNSSTSNSKFSGNFTSGYIYFKYGQDESNDKKDRESTKQEEVEVADTAMNVSSVIYVISALSIVAGISIIAGITMKARKN